MLAELRHELKLIQMACVKTCTMALSLLCKPVPEQGLVLTTVGRPCNERCCKKSGQEHICHELGKLQGLLSRSM